MSVKLEAALAYSRMHWRIFPCHSVINGVCTCGKTHPDGKGIGKHPRTKGGFKDATDDEATIRRWWTRWPDANIALATGSGLAVFDIDGDQGAQEFKALVQAHETVPDTLVAQTGRGFHLIFATRSGSPEVRSSARGSVHVRGEGGYIILPPSDHVSGRKYKWIKKIRIATLPDWLKQWSQGYEIVHKTSEGFPNLGSLPTYLLLPDQRDISQTASEALKTVWSPAEQSRLISALSAIDVKSCGYEDYLRIGFAIHSLGWDRSDGTSIAFDIWDEWCAQSEHYNKTGLEAKWKNFDRTARGDINIGTLYHLAQQRGWNGGAPDPSSPSGYAGRSPSPEPLNGHANGSTAFPAAFGGLQPIFFPDRTEEGRPKPTYTNAIVAVEGLGIICEHDLFHNRMLVAGAPLAQWSTPELSDNVVHILRSLIRHRFGFDPNKINTADACQFLCLKNAFDPILDYLDELKWDGQPRLDDWLTTYMGAVSTEFCRAVARLSLIAAVRRAREPATKFDQIIVLEGPTEGKGKSTAIKILAGAENFSDQKILGVDDRKQQELTEGVWLYEISELTGMNRAEVEHVKAFASRDTDRARPAYGRFQVSQKRRTVFFASTNRTADYLISDTGNRRFWPVLTGHIDLVGLARDRDQLWAEAAGREAKGESHLLPEYLWKAAGEEQAGRMTTDAWREPILQYLGLKPREDVGIMEVLVDNQFLQLKPGEVSQREQNRAASILRGLEFVRFQKRMTDGQRIWRYRPPT